MLTTPARSDHSPAMPASRIGTASRRAAPAVPEEVMSCAPEIQRVKESRIRMPAQIRAGRTQTGRRRRAGVAWAGPAGGVLTAVAITLLRSLQAPAASHRPQAIRPVALRRAAARWPGPGAG